MYNSALAMSVGEPAIGAGEQRNEIKREVLSEEVTGTAEIDDNLAEEGMTLDDEIEGPSTSDMFCSPE